MNLNNIDLNKIRVFHSVVENGTYQLAGEDLGLTRSAICQSITTLESQLGAQLFQRKGKRLFPTQRAKELASEFSISQKKLASILGKIRNEESNIEGVVRIGSYFEFAKTQLSQLISNFSEKFPDSQFRLVFDSPSRLQDLLESGAIDMSFSIFKHKGSTEVDSIKAFEQELVLVAPKTMAKKVQNLENLLNLPIIEYFKSHLLLPRWIQTHFKKQRPKIQPKIFASSAEMLIELVEQGAGIGVAPLYLVEARKPQNIKVIRPTQDMLIDYIWLNQFSGQFENSAHKEFYQWVQERL